MTTTTKSETPTNHHDGSAKTEEAGPVIIDLGKQPRRRIKRLLRGRGKLMTEIHDCIAELRRVDKLSTSAEPVVLVVREKKAKGRGLWPKP